MKLVQYVRHVGFNFIGSFVDVKHNRNDAAVGLIQSQQYYYQENFVEIRP